MDAALYERAIAIRVFEERLLALFSAGKLSGTVHTCIGQELNAVAVAENLRPADWVFSNHRCHGHYLALYPEPEGLLAEIMGHPSGLCGGRGGSQHICRGRFFSNGIQGGGMPIATGCALAETRLPGSDAISVAFIGDGTLGQGVLYESLNLASLWSVPLLVVIEHNGYAQSTPTATTIAGDILRRFEAFGLTCFEGDIWDPEKLFRTAKEAVDAVRTQRKPVALKIGCYRLKAHSKGDDNRDAADIAKALERDPLMVFEREHAPLAREIRAKLEGQLDDIVAHIDALPARSRRSQAEIEQPAPVQWEPVGGLEGSPKVVERLRAGLAELLERDPDAMFIGEDLEDGYGGAFKVSKGLSTRFPGRVRNTPISEAAIVGIGTGVAMTGRRAVVEIMFGDFVTLAADQIVNQASKFAFIYDGQVAVPLIVRTPMGGRRGYGATHSQSLERMFFGTPGLEIFAVNDVFDPKILIERIVEDVKGPVLLVENKSLYGAKVRNVSYQGVPWEESGGRFPTLRLSVGGGSDVTVVVYGGSVEETEAAVRRAFLEFEVRCDVVVPMRLQPLDMSAILESVRKTRHVVVVEEGQGFAGFGAEVVARCAEMLGADGFRAGRCFAADHPIPCSRAQEVEALPRADSILQAIVAVKEPQATV